MKEIELLELDYVSAVKKLADKKALTKAQKIEWTFLVDELCHKMYYGHARDLDWPIEDNKLLLTIFIRDMSITSDEARKKDLQGHIRLLLDSYRRYLNKQIAWLTNYFASPFYS